LAAHLIPSLTGQALCKLYGSVLPLYVML
jgi:hypothetical protein